MLGKGFGVEFIAPKEFSSKEWWLPIRPGLRWFYHTQRRERPSSSAHLITGTLDEELVPLVRAARALGLETEASCAGHAVSADYTKKLYVELLRDAKRVNNKGLPLVNVETNQVVCWQDPNYTLPWLGWQVLNQHLQDNSLVGLITLAGRHDLLKDVEQALHTVPEVIPEWVGPRLQLWVAEDNHLDQAKAWLRAAKAVNRVYA
jgi:hypothetical protein